MRRYVLLLALGALLGVIATAADAESPATSKLMPPELKVDVGFSPGALPKSVGVPVSLSVRTEISQPELSQPPALRELVMELDKGIEVRADGIPSCKRSRLGKTTETAVALKACRPALIGEGQATLETAFDEMSLIVVHSKLLVFKGGESDGTMTLLVHAYFPAPFSSSIVVPVIIGKRPNGPFGTHAVAKIPMLNVFSIPEFNFRLFKEVEVGGKRYNPISAACPEGKLRVLSQGTFEDGSKAETELISTCTARG
jgi:hypothetical protein